MPHTRQAFKLHSRVATFGACLGCVMVFAMAALVPAHADDGGTDTNTEIPAARLQAVQRDIVLSRAQAQAQQQRAAEVSTSIATLQDASVAVAKIVQQNEASLSAAQEQVAALQKNSAAKLAAIDATHGREAKLLAALQRVAIEPPAALVFAPGSPLESLRSGMLLGAILPQLRAEALSLDRQLADLDQLRTAMETKQAEAAEKQVALIAQQQHLAQLMAHERVLEAAARREAGVVQRRLDTLSSQASDLKDLIRRLDAERQRRQEAEQAEQRRNAARAAAERTDTNALSQASLGLVRHAHVFVAGKTALLWPAAGKLVTRFGQTDGFVTAKGLTIATRPGAEVVAPFDGQVLFAGPFRGYGQILIIEHPGGYDSLLAGCDHIDSVVGQSVVAGEPVARMRTGAGNPSLYFEWRHKDQPVDPSAWLAAP